MTGAMAGRPAADVEVTVDLVRALLTEQHPDLAGLALRVVATGWDNVMLRLGDELVVRVPRRAGSVVGLANEQRWLPALAPRLPVPIPVPVRVGVPGAGYPYVWSVVPWLAGEPADSQALSPAGVADLATFLRALHTQPPADAPHNPFRGVPLAERDAAFVDRRDRAAARGVDVSGAAARWAAGLAAPSAEVNAWLHGDVHHGNLLVSPEGRLAAVIDWNDVCAGDPAVDLAAAWLVADDADAFFAAYGQLSAGVRERAAAWAAYLALLFLEADAPGESLHERTGRAALSRLSRGR
jgi:aminoglycoside phosphotransferase (APT) family kinase protein